MAQPRKLPTRLPLALKLHFYPSPPQVLLVQIHLASQLPLFGYNFCWSFYYRSVPSTNADFTTTTPSTAGPGTTFLPVSTSIASTGPTTTVVPSSKVELTTTTPIKAEVATNVGGPAAAAAARLDRLVGDYQTSSREPSAYMLSYMYI